MEKQNETVTEEEGGEELARVIVDHWHAGAGSAIFWDDLLNASMETRQSTEAICEIIEVMDRHRGYSLSADVLGSAFVPQKNVQAVCDLLDQIQMLCED